MPASVQIAPVLLPGRDNRFAEPLHQQIDPLVNAIDRELRPWLDVPYAVFGHSMGALLAFEWVRRLQSEKQPMPQWLFLSGRPAPQTPPDSRLYSLPDREFVKALHHRYQGISDDLLQNPELMEVFLPILRADISVVESYRFRNGDPLDCPMTVSAGMNDVSVAYDQLLAWKQHAAGRFTAHLFPGGHFYPQEPLVKMIRTTLAASNLAGRPQ